MSNFKISLANYTFEIPKNKNIIIIATNRTGSTALGDLLSQLTKVPFLGEFFHSNPNRFTNKSDLCQQHIIKIMPDQMPSQNYRELLFGNSFIIGLYREDVIAQVLSNAIAIKINSWQQKNFSNWQQEKNTESVLIHNDFEISNKQFLHCAKILQDSRSRWTTYRDFFNVTLCYEQLVPDLEKSRYDVMPKIKSYDDTLAHFRSLYGNEVLL